MLIFAAEGHDGAILAGDASPLARCEALAKEELRRRRRFPARLDRSADAYVVRRGEALGIATPANRALHALVKLLESKATKR